MMIQQIKKTLLEYHKVRGFTLYESFPLLTKDPSVLFTNATITPFKHLFVAPDGTPENFALVQRCLRVGGGAGSPEAAYRDANYSSLFHMFGSGLFGTTIEFSVEYFLNMLTATGLSRENLRFTVPAGTPFYAALMACGIDSSAVFTISENGEFWQEWRFGKNDLVGKGLTAIYASRGQHASSVEEMARSPQRFVELGNLIHIYGKTNGDELASIPHEGFDVGIGLERLTALLRGCTLYELTPLKELVDLVTSKLKVMGGRDPEPGTVRVATDHLRSIDALIQEGINPGKKQHEFVLRKLIRSLLETVWLFADRIVSTKEIIQAFAELDVPESAIRVSEVVAEEEAIFLGTLKRGQRVLARNSSLSPEVLMDTYGIRQALIPLLEKG